MVLELVTPLIAEAAVPGAEYHPLRFVPPVAPFGLTVI